MDFDCCSFDFLWFVEDCTFGLMFDRIVDVAAGFAPTEEVPSYAYV